MATNAITCPSCGVEETFDADGSRPPPLHEVAEFVCNACGTRVVYGRVMSKLTHEWVTDEHGFRWLRRRYIDAITGAEQFAVDLDPRMAAVDARNTLMLVIR